MEPNQYSAFKGSKLILTIIGSFLGMLLVWFAGSSNGPGITYDSENYLFAGEHLAKYGSLMRPNKVPFTTWTPLFPCIISIFAIFFNEPAQAVFIFHILFFGLVVYKTGAIFGRYFNNKIIFTFFLASISFSTPLILVHHFVWSEPLFILLILYLFEIVLDLSLNPKRFSFILLLVLGCLLSLQRQASVFILPGIYFGAFLITQKQREIVSVKKLIFLYLGSSIPVFTWWSYNKIKYLNSIDNIFDVYNPTFLKHLFFHHQTLTSWILPDEIPLWLRMILFYACLISLVLIFFKWIKIDHSLKKPVLILIGMVFLMYLGSTYLICSLFDHPFFDEERILAVVYIFGISIPFFLLDEIASKLDKKHLVVVLVGLSIWIIYPVTRAVHNVKFWHEIPKSTYLRP